MIIFQCTNARLIRRHRPCIHTWSGGVDLEHDTVHVYTGGVSRSVACITNHDLQPAGALAYYVVRACNTIHEVHSAANCILLHYLFGGSLYFQF